MRTAMATLLLMLLGACNRSPAPQASSPVMADAAVPSPAARPIAPAVPEEPAPAILAELALEAASVDREGPVVPQPGERPHAGPVQPQRMPSYVFQVDARGGHTRDADGCLSPPLQAFEPYKESFELPIVAVFGRDARARLVPKRAAPWQSADGGAPREDQLKNTVWYAVACTRPGYVHVQAAYMLFGGSEGFRFEATFEGKRWRLMRRYNTWIE
jgi:hypothetical protein